MLRVLHQSGKGATIDESFLNALITLAALSQKAPENYAPYTQLAQISPDFELYLQVNLRALFSSPAFHIGKIFFLCIKKRTCFFNSVYSRNMKVLICCADQDRAGAWASEGGKGQQSRNIRADQQVFPSA